MAQDSELPDNPTLLDATDRLERTIDLQVERLADLDEKAAHTTRLVGILLALVFTLLTLVLREGPASLGAVTMAVQVTFVLGLGALLVSLLLAIVTYLSSRCRIGLHQTVASFLRDHGGSVSLGSHLRFVLGSYGVMIAENKRAIHQNARLFRTSLGSLLSGVLFLSAAGLLYFGHVTGRRAWVVTVATIGAAFVLNWILAQETFMENPPHVDDDV